MREGSSKPSNHYTSFEGCNLFFKFHSFARFLFWLLTIPGRKGVSIFKNSNPDRIIINSHGLRILECQKMVSILESRIPTQHDCKCLRPQVMLSINQGQFAISLFIFPKSFPLQLPSSLSEFPWLANYISSSLPTSIILSHPPLPQKMPTICLFLLSISQKAWTLNSPKL